MATIVTRAGKGSPLTHTEVDANFTNLNNDKSEVGHTHDLVSGTTAGFIDRPHEGPDRFVALNDFITTTVTNLWSLSGSGAGSGAAIITTPTTGVGWIEGSTGTASDGRVCVSCPNLNIIDLGRGPARWRDRVIFPTLSDGTNTYTHRTGFIDVTNAESTDAAYFRYTHSVNGGRWQAVTRSNASETAADTCVAPVAGTANSLDIRSDGGSNVLFYIDGVLVATITTNIPTGSARLTGYGALIIKSVGTTSRSFQSDYMYCEQLFTGR